MEDRLLPLIFVSPGQINAQLLSSLGEGDYTLTILSGDGSATITGTLPVIAGLINIPLASLTTAGTPFNDMTSLLLEFRPQVAGTDMVIDAFGFDLPAPNPVPEAGTYAAIGFVGALAGWTYRRRAVKA